MPVDRLDNAPRCQHTKMNGDPCAAPARRGTQFCVFHAPAHNTERLDYSLAVIEDATSLQFGIMQVMRALADHAIESKTAALMLYGLQIAASNLKRFTAEQTPDPDSQEPSLPELLLRHLGLPTDQPPDTPPPPGPYGVDAATGLGGAS